MKSVLTTACAALLACAWADDAQASLDDCIAATCRITAPDGSTGSGCVFEVGSDRVYVLTAAHVVEGSATVACEFWQQGHQSVRLPARVASRGDRYGSDVAVVVLDRAVFGGRVPAALPLAPRDYLVKPGQELVSVGSAQGQWATAWRGHAMGVPTRQSLFFAPTPARGRSGSALFDADGRQIVGVISARSDRGNGDGSSQAEPRWGIAVPTAAMYAIFSQQAAWKADGMQTQCAPGSACPLGGCENGSNSYRLLPYRQQQQQQQTPRQQPVTPYPTLPLPEARAPDLGPLEQRLDRIADMLGSIRRSQEAAPPSVTPAPAPVPAAPAAPPIDQEARGMAQAALDAAAKAGEAAKRLTDGQATLAKSVEAVVGETKRVATDQAALLKDVTEHGNFLLRHAITKQEVQERLGENASNAKVEVETLKEMVRERVGEGNTRMWIIAGAIVAVLLIVIIKDVRDKRETGDPLIAEKIAVQLAARFAGVPGLGTAALAGERVVRHVVQAVHDRASGEAPQPTPPPTPGG